jgi:hypothetical protein
MSAEQNIADAMNRWAKDGLDMMGGADGVGLNRLLDDYFLLEDGDPPLPGCKR